MSGTTKQNTGIRWYRCNVRHNHSTCGAAEIRADELEGMVITQVQTAWKKINISLALKQATQNKSPATEKETSQLREELKSISAKKKRWYDAYEAGAMSLSDLKERVKSLSDTEMSLQTRIDEIQSPPRSLNIEKYTKTISQFRELWSRATTQERKELAHGMIKEIIAVSRSEIKVVLKIAD